MKWLIKYQSSVDNRLNGTIIMLLVWIIHQNCEWLIFTWNLIDRDKKGPSLIPLIKNKDLLVHIVHILYKDIYKDTFIIHNSFYIIWEEYSKQSKKYIFLTIAYKPNLPTSTLISKPLGGQEEDKVYKKGLLLASMPLLLAPPGWNLFYFSKNILFKESWFCYCFKFCMHKCVCVCVFFMHGTSIPQLDPPRKFTNKYLSCYISFVAYYSTCR